MMWELLTRCALVRRIGWCLRAAMLVAACGMCASAHGFEHTYHVGTEDGSGVAILVNSPFKTTPQSGFMPVHVKIRNDRPERRTWVFSFTDRAMGQGSQGKYQETISVGPMQVRETYIFVPRPGLESMNYSYQSISGTVQGPGVSRGSFPLPSSYRSGGYVTPFILVSQSMAGTSWSTLETQLKGGLNSVSPGNDLSLVRIRNDRSSNRGLRGSPVNLTELPADERALSGVAGVILTDADWHTLPPPMQKMIAHWVHGGGRLAVVVKESGKLTLPGLPAFNGVDASVPLGFGSVNFMLSLNGEMPVANAAAFAIALDAVPTPAWEIDYTGTEWSLPAWVGWPQLNVPLVIGFVCIFALVIGPLNLQWLAPETKRHRLFFTVPALSVLASVCLIGVIALGEGTGGIGARNVILSVDSAGTRVNLLQEQVARTRLLIGRDFKLGQQTLITFVDPDSRKNEGRELARSQDGSAVGDWFRSRSVQKHQLNTAIPSRAEVTLVKKAEGAGGPTLLSSIPGTLRTVFYIDEEKRYWRADELATGRPTVLKATHLPELERSLEEHREPFSRSFNAVLENTLHRPGHFYAFAERSAEWPLETLPSIDWKKETIFVFGPCTVKEAK